MDVITRHLIGLSFLRM